MCAHGCVHAGYQFCTYSSTCVYRYVCMNDCMQVYFFVCGDEYVAMIGCIYDSMYDMYVSMSVCTYDARVERSYVCVDVSRYVCAYRSMNDLKKSTNVCVDQCLCVSMLPCTAHMYVCVFACVTVCVSVCM